MRRDIIRYPVGQQFKKILEDGNEWLVITDMRLKPLVMKRGDKYQINGNTRDQAYQELVAKMPPGKTARVYGLHTHPYNDYSPSPGDLAVNIDDKILMPYGIIFAGQGMITPKGIFIIKLPENMVKQLELKYTKLVPQKYEFITEKLLIAKLHEKMAGSAKLRRMILSGHIPTDEEIERELNIYGDEAKAKFQHRLNMKVINAIKTVDKDIKTKMVRRTHRATMRRRK